MNRTGNLSLIMLIQCVLLALAANFCYSQPAEPALSRQDYIYYPVEKSEVIALDQPIDPLAYKLGPGDQIAIFIWGNIQAQYNLTVSPEGKLLIPTVGPIEVAGFYLFNAKQLIENRILERFKNIKVETELSGLRRFKVAVGGAVKYPGIYNASGVTRVSDIITMAGGFAAADIENTWSRIGSRPTVFPPGIASHRNIIIKHGDGKMDTADVLLFEQISDLSYNYRLTDGDEIFVPLRESQINLYGIFGGVKNPAFYEYSHRDSLRNLINLAHGLTLDADSAGAELVRFAEDGRTLLSSTVQLSDILKGKEPDIKLHPDDRIFIKKINNFNEKDQVLLIGEVLFPGFYAIVPDSTYLSEVINRAGGFAQFASLPEAEMTRFAGEDISDPEFERLKQMDVADMNDLEYEYFKIKSRQKRGRVAINFVELFEGSGKSDVKLRNGDVINIPRRSQVVNIVGEVANPGFLTYKPDLNYLDYINLAGGYSFRADKSKVRIIKGATGEWKKAGRSTALYPGDVILVPEKQKSKFFQNLRDVIAFTANIATVYLVIREATR
jgi:protein involved in polysaccharide export with SLBB domain